MNGKIIIISVQIKVFFRVQNLWSLVETDYAEVKDQTKFDALEKDKKDALMETKKKDQKAL